MDIKVVASDTTGDLGKIWPSNEKQQACVIQVVVLVVVAKMPCCSRRHLFVLQMVLCCVTTWSQPKWSVQWNGSLRCAGRTFAAISGWPLATQRTSKMVSVLSINLLLLSLVGIFHSNYLSSSPIDCLVHPTTKQTTHKERQENCLCQFGKQQFEGSR